MRILHLFVVLVILVPLLMAGAVYGLFLFWGHDLPSPRRPQEVEPPRNTVLLDRNGDEIGEFFVENRSPAPLAQIPDVMRQAVLATEDRRFYRHWGIDLAGVGRALFSDLAAGGIRQGASTITQQLARNIFLSHSQTVERKIKEAILAIRLERSFSKEEILQLYLNEIYFGEGAYGVEAASERFFGKSCRQLTLRDAALLAGLPANPGAYSPLRHPEAARRRRNAVLRKMEAAGIIDRETREAAEASDLDLSPGRGGGAMQAPYFAEMVRQELMDRFGGDAVYGGGLVVHTTLDLRLQAAADSALENQLETIESRQALVYRRRNSAVRREVSGGPQAITPYLQGALVALEPQNGAIRAMVGGRDFNDSNFNRALQARRQPGSAFKPILMAEALREGYRTNTVLLDAPVTYRWDNQVWSPKNFHNDYSGEVTLRYVLMKSINVPSVRLLDRVGTRNVIRLARQMGLSGPFTPQLSLALGTSEVTPLEITSAYSAFANGGIRQEPYAIDRVEDRFGNVLEQRQPQPHEVLDEKTSYLMVSLLRSVIDHGTGYTARGTYGFDAPAGGKTGTTDDYSDAWFVGFIPQLACGVWVGFDEKKSIGSRMTGAAAALPTWSTFMNAAVRVYGKEDFAVPDGIVSVTTCQKTGLLAVPGCPRVVHDAFIAGTQPTTYCPLHQGLPPPPGGSETYEPEPDVDEEAPSPNP